MKKKYTRKWIGTFLKGVIILMSLFLLSACGGKEGSKDAGLGTFGGGKGKELAEDTPWNHGMHAMMETEKGYYSSMATSNYQQTLCLRYYDKETGTTMLLCNKPECQHEGDSTCEATYKGIRVMHTALYEDAIYVLGVEDSEGTTGIHLYRAALDGSSIDKVGTVISAPHPMDESGNPKELILKQADAYDGIYQDLDYSFILHKGQAYIPYYLRFGKGMSGFQGGGLMKMDLKTGETQVLYELEHANKGVPGRLAAQGNYVWFRFYANYKGSNVKRYNIEKDEIEDFYGNGFIAADSEEKSNLQTTLLGENVVYDLSYTIDEKMNPDYVVFHAYDMETGAYLKDQSIVTDKKFQKVEDAFYYEGTIFWGDVYGLYAVNVKGEQEHELALPAEHLGLDLDRKGADVSLKNLKYLINDGELYLLFWDGSDVRYQSGGYGYRKRVFACPLKDFLADQGSWTEVFTIEGYKVQESFLGK